MGNKSTVAVNGTTFQMVWNQARCPTEGGGVLSCFLHCVFINDLQNCLENVDTKFGVHNVKSTNPALADDIVCISVSPVGLQKC